MNQIKSIIATTTIAACMLACQSPKTTDETSAQDTVETVQKAPLTLNLKWETDTVLTTCESVLYDQERDLLYVSNINGQPDGKDGNGFISKVNLDGKVIELEWVKGLNAPKGLGQYKDKLYVADIDRVLEVDVSNGKITKSFAVDDAKFLNDITVDSTGRIYISDTGAGNIMLIENGKLTKWMENIDAPNGLLAEGNKLQMLTWSGQTVNTIDVPSKQVTMRIDSIENLDGIEAMADAGYILSSWNGLIHYVDEDWNNTMVLDLRADSVNSADIEYIEARKLLLVPTFFKNSVRAYEVSR
ncbi:MAG TPA: hypothetical protein VD927_16325 [Chryseosolibacter sp.]|nr:hypothetical protein [Chryseosolibacter sp.]